MSSRDSGEPAVDGFAGERDRPTLILLGASNLTAALPLIVEQATAALGPLELLAAAGHGRSYGGWSRFVGRGLPAILDSGLWSRLDRGPRQTLALITDVGNDIGYGRSPQTVAAWVGTCAERLLTVDARIVLTLPPRATLTRMPRWTYHLAKAVLFPGRRLPYARMVAHVTELDFLLRRLGERLGLRIVEPRAEWLAADAIHIRRRRRRQAWGEVLAAWGSPFDRPASGSSRPPRLSAAPEVSTLLGIGLRRLQPSQVLPDGTGIWLF